MPADRDFLITWLRDAHAMEASTIDNLQKQVDQFKNFPTLQARFREHLEVSRQQKDRIETCLSQLGSDTSTLKDSMTKLVGNVQAWLTSLAADDVVKQAIGATAFEHFEIANYRALIATASHCEEPAIRTMLEQSLREEEAMAQWLEQHLPELTRQFLESKVADAPMKSGGP